MALRTLASETQVNFKSLSAAAVAVAVAGAMAVATLAIAVPQGVGWADAGRDLATPAAGTTEPSFGESLITPVLSARRVPGLLQAQTLQTELADRLNPLIAAAPPASCLTVTTAAGQTYAHNPDLPLAPASAVKLLTAAATVATLGADHTWQTTAMTSGTVADGVLDGDLVIVGGADPILATSGYAASQPWASQRSVSAFEDLADDLAASGITIVTGAVVGNDDRHDTQRLVETWPRSYLIGDTVGALGALRVNAGRRGWTESPSVAGVGGGPGDPAVLAAATMTTLLAERGVTVTGAPTRGPVPSGATKLTATDGATMQMVLDEIVGFSNNGAAELVVKELALASGRPPTTVNGLAVIGELAEQWGLDTTGLNLVDGSGLDPTNTTTCQLLTDLLLWLEQPSPTLEALSVAGEWGTLSPRPLPVDATGRLEAKTGTLNTVRSLAGLATPPDGNTATFAFIANGAPDDPGLDNALADAVGAALATDLTGVDYDLVGPVAVAGLPHRPR